MTVDVASLESITKIIFKKPMHFYKLIVKNYSHFTAHR